MIACDCFCGLAPNRFNQNLHFGGVRILVGKAFGNYLDLLKEVTFSPLMAEYLSFLRNPAYDHDQNYPDENYAREAGEGS